MLFNTVNGKIYIGKTNNLKKRKREHLSCKIESKSYSLIHRAISKHGRNNFQLTVIQEFKSRTDANKAEQYWIKFYKTFIKEFGNDYGYNLTAGGDGMQAGTLSGTRNPRAKLTEIEVLEIKNSKLPTIELSKQYNVDRTIIQRIRSGKIWSDKNVENTFRGNYPRRDGEFSKRAKLTKSIVSNIRQEYLAGSSISSIAKKNNISWTNIKMIVTNKTWKLF